MTEFDDLKDYGTASACAICGSRLTSQPISDGGGWKTTCENCGRYRITDSAFEDLKGWLLAHPLKLRLLAYTVRKRERPDSHSVVDTYLLERVLSEGEYPGAFEQVENLIIWLAENLPNPGWLVDIVYPSFQAVIGVADEDGFSWVVRSAHEEGWIDGIESQTMGSPYELMRASLTLSGWQWYSEYGHHKRSRIAFMAMQYDDEKLDTIVKDRFAPAIAQAGFELRRLDTVPEAGIIDNRLRVEIRRSRILIADLTHDNRGAYWEAGFAEGLGLPVIYTCEKSQLESVHFDSRNCLIVPWEESDPGGSSASMPGGLKLMSLLISAASFHNAQNALTPQLCCCYSPLSIFGLVIDRHYALHAVIDELFNHIRLHT